MCACTHIIYTVFIYVFLYFRCHTSLVSRGILVSQSKDLAVECQEHLSPFLRCDEHLAQRHGLIDTYKEKGLKRHSQSAFTLVFGDFIIHCIKNLMKNHYQLRPLWVGPRWDVNSEKSRRASPVLLERTLTPLCGIDVCVMCYVNIIMRRKKNNTADVTRRADSLLPQSSGCCCQTCAYTSTTMWTHHSKCMYMCYHRATIR